jgi:cytochrome P450
MHAEDNRSAVFWSEALQAWVLTGLRECMFVCSREDLFLTQHSNFRLAREIRGERSVALLDGDAHRRMHAVLSAFFVGPQVAAVTIEFLRPIIERVIGELIGRKSIELASEFADQVPARTIAGLLGLPIDDDHIIRCYVSWSAAVTQWVQSKGEDENACVIAADAAQKMSEALQPIIRSRQLEPCDDLISVLWREGPAIFTDWSEDDVLDQCRLLFLAGDGVSQLICSTLYLLLTDPSLRDVVVKDQETHLPRLIEETLRLYPPAQLRVRQATCAVALAGVTIQPGDLVYPFVQEANRDSSRFQNPGTLDLNRAYPSRHLAFNVGPRYCIGAGLSRLVSLESIGALLKQMPNMSIEASTESPAFVGFRFRGFRPLYISIGT